jgi:hypothetical protein
MNFALFLILLIALIIILISIILYNGLKIELFSKKEKSNFEIEFKASILNITIFKRQYPSHEDKALETEEENSVKDEESLEDSQEDKSLREKFNEFKPLLNDLKNSKHEIKEFLMSVFKDTDFKELDGYLKLGLGDYAKTARIMGWIWSFNAIANTFGEPLHLKGEATFTEEVIDFDIHAIIKLNLLLLIFHALKLVSHKNVRTLIRNSISYFKGDKSDKKFEKKENSRPQPQ